MTQNIDRPDYVLIRKGGYYYRDNWCGYTTDVLAAGRYLREEAQRHVGSHPTELELVEDLPSDDLYRRVETIAAQCKIDIAARRQETPRCGSEFAGDIDPTDDLERTIAIVRAAYGWTLTDDLRLCGLVAGDMGYASTHIVLYPEGIDALGIATKVDQPQLLIVLRDLADKAQNLCARLSPIDSDVSDLLEAVSRARHQFS